MSVIGKPEFTLNEEKILAIALYNAGETSTGEKLSDISKKMFGLTMADFEVHDTSASSFANAEKFLRSFGYYPIKSKSPYVLNSMKTLENMIAMIGFLMDVQMYMLKFPISKDVSNFLEGGTYPTNETCSKYFEIYKNYEIAGKKLIETLVLLFVILDDKQMKIDNTEAKKKALKQKTDYYVAALDEAVFNSKIADSYRKAQAKADGVCRSRIGKENVKEPGLKAPKSAISKKSK
jgi:hypothetical protein